MSSILYTKTGQANVQAKVPYTFSLMSRATEREAGEKLPPKPQGSKGLITSNDSKCGGPHKVTQS